MDEQMIAFLSLFERFSSEGEKWVIEHDNSNNPSGYGRKITLYKWDEVYLTIMPSWIRLEKEEYRKFVSRYVAPTFIHEIANK